MKHFLFNLELQLSEDGIDNAFPSKWIVSAINRTEAIFILYTYMLNKYKYIGKLGNYNGIQDGQPSLVNHPVFYIDFVLIPAQKDLEKAGLSRNNASSLTSLSYVQIYLPGGEENSMELTNKEFTFLESVDVPVLTKADLDVSVSQNSTKAFPIHNIEQDIQTNELG